ncbi:MAG: hypothetical protein NC548_58055 [Lachnospiraceae bacterium]|nr:hypothetical protein [Lachnospiraceae bacterium]
MKLRIIDGNKLHLPCKPGDKYYTVDPILGASGENIYHDRNSGQTILQQELTIVDYLINEHKWISYAEIVQALEVGRIGKNIILTYKGAKNRLEKMRSQSH